ncbi:MAG: RQC domain-containing protein, partial [Bacteroidota bacterium]
RAGRDGLGGDCLAFYAYKDILKLEKFLRDKPVAEREMSMQLMNEVTAYSETTACRRKFLLHYFGEEYDDTQCSNMCDNCRHPKPKVDVKLEAQQALQAVLALEENYGIKTLVDFVKGKGTKEMKDFRFDKRPLYGVGKEQSELFWFSVFRQAMLTGLIRKDIESYGLLKMKAAGQAFIEQPSSFMMSVNHDFAAEGGEVEEEARTSKAAVLDKVLMKILKDLRRQEAKRKNIPPYVIFQDPSLIDMATQYPLSTEDMAKISGVSKGKAARYGRPFVQAIKAYVEENEIERPMDFVVKQVANKSKAKISIIQSIDRKIPLEDIADSLSFSMEGLLEELDAIVTSGTKVNIDYYIDENIDEYSREDITDYFMESDSDCVHTAFKELQEDDITLEEIQIVRLKFLSDMAN